MMIFPTIAIITWVPATIQRAYEYYTNDTLDWLFYLEVIASGFRGFFDSLAYATLVDLKLNSCLAVNRCCPVKKKTDIY